MVYKKDVGVCTFAYPDSRPSHCLPPRISNVHSPRQDEIYRTSRQAQCLNTYIKSGRFRCSIFFGGFKSAKFGIQKIIYRKRLSNNKESPPALWLVETRYKENHYLLENKINITIFSFSIFHINLTKINICILYTLSSTIS